jgi:uncharacterized protein YraI
MKRLLLIGLACVLAFTVVPALAQSQPGDVIVLDDTTPSITANVTLPKDATGVVSLNLNNASVLVTDSTGKTVFQVADGRVHNLELSIVPNSGAQTITVERLPGALQAAVTINSLIELTNVGTAQFVDAATLTPNQERALKLDSSNPGGTVQFDIPTNSTGVMSSTYFGANVTSQLVDKNGTILATSYGGAIDGLNMVLDGGSYNMTLVGNGLTTPITAGVQVMPSDPALFAVLELPAATPAPEIVSAATAIPLAIEPTTVPDQTVAQVCDATVAGTSVNLRSGPGTGYNVLGYGYQNETYPVGGINPEQNWLVIGLPNGSAWVSRSLVNVIGSCDNLTVFNIPLQNAQDPQIIVQPNNNGGSQSNSVFSGGESHEHEDREHGEHEGGGDDD